MSESKDTVNNVNKADSSSNNDTTTTNDNNNNIEDAEAKRLEEERAARRKNAQDKLETSKKEMEAAKASDSEAASKIAADLGLEVAGGQGAAEEQGGVVHEAVGGHGSSA